MRYHTYYTRWAILTITHLMIPLNIFSLKWVWSVYEKWYDGKQEYVVSLDEKLTIIRMYIYIREIVHTSSYDLINVIRYIA